MIRVFIFLMCCLVSMTSLARVSAHIYRDTISINDSFELTINTDDSQAESPDLSILNKDFEILSTAVQRHVSIVNGNRKEKKQWVVRLIPRSTGKLPIPAIKVGKESTQLLVIKVEDAKKPSTTGEFEYYLLEGELDTSTPYVQAQVIYTVKLFYVNGISLNGQLEEPVDADNFLVEKLGDDVRYKTTRFNCTYNVLERKYALFPQKSGKIRIPVISFQGTMADVSGTVDCRAGMVPQFSLQSGPFFSQRSANARTKRLQINVKPIPKEFGADAWLPAKSLTISESWSPNLDAFKVGQPVTRTIVIKAKGLSAIQLPDIPVINNKNFKSYSDKAKNVNKYARNLLISEKEQKIAMIANNKGGYKLPDIKIKWWDTQADRIRMATLSGNKIIVKESDKPVLPDLDNKINNSEKDVRVQEKDNAIDLGYNYWKPLGIGFFVLWLLTLIFFIYHYQIRNRRLLRQKQPREMPIAYGNLKRDLLKSCQNNNANEAKKYLLILAEKLWGKDVNNLVSMGQMLSNKNLQESLLELDHALYSANKGNWKGVRLAKHIDKLFVKKEKNTRKKNTDPLPNLYPTN